MLATLSVMTRLELRRIVGTDLSHAALLVLCAAGARLAGGGAH